LLEEVHPSLALREVASEALAFSGWHGTVEIVVEDFDDLLTAHLHTASPHPGFVPIGAPRPTLSASAADPNKSPPGPACRCRE
jgi:hypothetical protein